MKGYVYGYFYRYKDGTLTRTYYNSLTSEIGWLREPVMYGSCLAFSLSNDRFGTIYTTNQQYCDTTSETMRIIVNIYGYSYDSSGNMTVTNLINHTLPWSSGLQYITPLDDDYFVVACGSDGFGFHIDSNNNIITTSTISGTFGSPPSRIGTSDSVYNTFSSSGVYVVWCG